MPAQFGGELVFDPRALAELLRGPSGPVYRKLLVDADVVRRDAQRRVGVHRPQPGEPGWSIARRKRRPGTLRDSIHVRVVRGAGGDPIVQVGSDDPIARLHHEGTPAHVIRARHAPMLVFYWGKVGQVVAFPKVNHPGTQPNHYLTDALSALRGR